MQLDIGILIAFIIYFALMVWIGFYFYRKSNNISDYFLGGRSLGSWVTALSPQASDMSGWLLLGLPAAAFWSGLSAAWIAIGLALGRGSYAFLMRAMFDLPNGQILKNANGMSALRGGRGWLPIVVHGVGFLFGISFFPYTLIVIALFGISLPQYLICYLLNDPIQKNIISPWERMQAQKET